MLHVRTFTYLALIRDISNNQSVSTTTHSLFHLCRALARHLVACRAAGCGLPSRHQRGALLASRLSASPAAPRMVPAPGYRKSVWPSFDSFSFTCCSASKSFLDNLLLTNRFKLASVHASLHFCCLSQPCGHDSAAMLDCNILQADIYKKNTKKENTGTNLPQLMV